MPDILFKCGSCGKHLVIDDAGAGTTINCPDCNAAVQIPETASPFKCPRCKEIFNLSLSMSGEAFKCSCCKLEIQASASLQAQALSTGFNSAVSETSAAASAIKRGQSNRLRLLAATTVLIVIAIGISVWRVSLMWSDRNSWKTVSAAAQAAGDNYEQASYVYQNYLNKFPEGSHAEEATEAIKISLPHKIDEQMWTRTTSAVQVVSTAYEQAIYEYQNYLKKHPQGIHAVEAKEFVNVVVPKQIDDRNWQRTQDDINKAGSDVERQIKFLEDFISQNSSSRWIPNAQNNLASLQKNYFQNLIARGEEAKNAGNWDTAVKAFRKAIVAGSSSAMVSLGLMYRDGLGTTRDYTEALKWFHKAVDAGDADGMDRLGAMFANGWGEPKDYDEALKWFHKAIDAGSTRGMANLGVMYANGLGVPKNYDEALKWYRKAADAGDAYGMGRLGTLYENGWGVQKDYVEALKWFHKAVDAGDAGGLASLGVMYANGWGVPQDYNEALNWYRKAADAGNVYGMENLGVIYAKGRGVPTNYNEALKWYRKAADAGSAHGMRLLGGLYLEGLGVQKDYDEALRWIRRGAELGDPRSKEAAEKLEQLLPSIKLAEQAAERAANPELEVLNAQVARSEFGSRILSGTVRNNINKEYKYVQVEFNLYDNSGAQVGSTFANVANLEPFGTWKFQAPVLEDSATQFKLKGVSGY